MKHRIEESKYTVLQPQDLWAFYSKFPGIFRGGGNISNPKIIRANGPRIKDVSVIYDHQHEIEMVIPDYTKGLSFAGEIEKLSNSPVISGYIWCLSKGVTLPEGLVFNVKDKKHPLLNVGIKMSLSEFTEKLRVLSSKMVSTNVRIEKGTGRIIEDYSGALSKIVGW